MIHNFEEVHRSLVAHLLLAVDADSAQSANRCEKQVFRTRLCLRSSLEQNKNIIVAYGGEHGDVGGAARVGTRGAQLLGR